MDDLKLTEAAEQRCKPYGCKVQKCMGSRFADRSQCNDLLREFMNCTSREKKKILEEIQAGKSTEWKKA
eukprot:CAMPEP_0115014578 /NCGR_PEP_ID=MMETSP0216-20121206/26180_1 /TAXON_ID=223996 /ORGANISM="Protocruzia adherens, Strain Boccale" /LENGTH=68 /DNA_ID=CAMNT_0002384381 /DNA_START=278 /DNA_END=484 /DNA_ORIENTATION=+